MKKYNLLNNLLGWLAFLISAVVYIMTAEPTASFWDCPEFITSAFKLEVGHPPGNTFFNLTGRFFANFAGGDVTKVAFMINCMSALLSAGTILFLYWTITHLLKKIVYKPQTKGDDSEEMSISQMITILGGGLVGSLLYTFTDTFWFSAVEAEVYAFSSFMTAFVKHYGIKPNSYRQTTNYKIRTQEKDSIKVKLSRGKAVELEPKTVIYISAKGDYKGLDYSAMFGRLWSEVKRQDIYSAGIEHLGVYYDSPEITDVEKLQCDICLRVCKNAEPNGEVGVKRITGGRFAMFTYIGEYNKVGAAYDKIYGELLAKNNWEPRGNCCFEKYRSDPRRTAPEKLRTEIYIPIK